MRIIVKSKLVEYWNKKQYKAAEQPLKAWHDEVKNAEWKNYNDLRKEFPKASIVGNDRVVFEQHEGAFRLIVKCEYKTNTY